MSGQKTHPVVLLSSLAGVAEWQTQRTQNPPGATLWGFESPLRHHFFKALTLSLEDPPPDPLSATTSDAGEKIMEPVRFTAIGKIRTPFTSREGTPIQPPGGRGVLGRVEVDEAFREGIRDLEGFSHVILLYHFHLSEGFDLTVKPFLDKTARGLFATRAPRRPNAIGLSVVRLVSIEGGTLVVEGVDMLDGTPLLDIKPFVPEFDAPVGEIRTGWLEGKADKAREAKADKRFVKG